MSLLHPGNAQFALVSFEGPDEYSRAGGLGVRVRDLATALAAAGFDTHLFFVGDPALPAVESDGRLTLHRWGQWISSHHPGGVYDGEWGKMQDMTRSLPPWLAESFIRAAAADARATVVMGEDWQIAPVMQGLHAAVQGAGLEGWTVPVWTANNLYGFERIDFGRLRQAAGLMTVSRYMKHQMWRYGVDPLVVPNGIAPSALVSVPEAVAQDLRSAFAADVALFKIGRFSPDKRWVTAVEALALLNRRGTRAQLLMRGDRLPHGAEVLDRARSLGLTVQNLGDRFSDSASLTAAISAHPEAQVLNLTAFLPDALVPPIYASVDGVLANSGHEPFGLVGLEVMGAGGLAVVGSTGEQYAEANVNAVVLDTDDPREIVVQLERLDAHHGDVARLKERGRQTAASYLWANVLETLLAKLEYVAMARGVEVVA